MAEELPKGSSKETFVVQVLFQQNKTWQGTITWTDQKKTQNFRSTMEMVKLMGEALEAGNEQENDSTSMKGWK